MGTSQAHSLKSGPNWSEAKRAVTNIAKNNGKVSSNCSKLMHGLANAIGGNSYTSGSLGHAGARVSKNFVGFIGAVKSNGYSGILDLLQIGNEQALLTKDDFIERVIVYVSGNHNSTEDDAAAIIAIEKLLNTICSDCVTVEDIVVMLQSASNDNIVEWIIFFEVEYILEYSGELFQSHILDKSEEPEKVMSEIRNWMHREIDERIGNKLYPHNFSSPEGKQVLDELTTTILDIWKQ